MSFNYKRNMILKILFPKVLIKFIRFIKHIFKQLLAVIKIKIIWRRKNQFNLEIGAGNKKGSGKWLTLDISDNCDIYWNLKNKLPFKNNSINKIYSSHVLEHFSYKEAQNLLSECRRVLVHNGEFSVCVPNARLYIDAYLNGEELNVEKFLGHIPSYPNCSKLDYINYIAYMNGEHKHIFDQGHLIAVLLKAGFKDVMAREFDSDIDLIDRKEQSIYAIAIK